MRVNISREVIHTEFEKLLEIIFSLPESVEVKVRHITVSRQQDVVERETAICHIMETSFHDIFSDIDLLVVVKRLPNDEAAEPLYMKRIDRYGMTADRLLGIVFVPESKMYRIVLKNGIRYDLGFEFVEDAGAKPLSDVTKMEVQKKKDIETMDSEQDLGTSHEEATVEDNPNWSLENVNRFWFVQIQALGKLYRDDYLIGDHLANMNVNETLVQQMVLRDLQYETNHHRYGYKEELQYTTYQQRCPYKRESTTFNGIAAKLYAAACAYDELTRKFYPAYQNRQNDFFAIWDAYELGVGR
ncbi:MAG: hypothetical protein EOM40_13820 [Clostridia bacterium]|nr:hypothetical protein [Clostridia bacterium]NCC42374.1 hypothetical protein [Clostridia bacterium]